MSAVVHHSLSTLNSLSQIMQDIPTSPLRFRNLTTALSYIPYFDDGNYSLFLNFNYPRAETIRGNMVYGKKSLGKEEQILSYLFMSCQCITMNPER